MRYFLYRYRSEIWIVIAALVVLLAYRFIVPIVDTPDSVTYWENAKFFAGVLKDYPYYYRPPGYPFLIFLSGYPYTHSVRALLVIQSLMALAIPLLAYHSLLIFGKKTAGLAAGLIIITLSNCYFSTAIMSEEYYIFCLMLFMYTVSKLCVNPRSNYIIWASMVAFLTILVRGLIVPLILVPLLITFIRDRRKSGIALACVGICLGAMYAWLVIKNTYTPDVQPNERFTNISLTNLEGRTLFSNIYLFSAMFNRSFIPEDDIVGRPASKVMRKNGHYTQQLFTILKKDYQEYPQTYSQYTSAKVMADDYEIAPSLRKWGALSFLILDRQMGVVAADRLLLEVSYEAIRKHPEIAITWLTNGILYLLGPPYMTQNDVQPVFYIPRLYIYYQSTESAKDTHYLKRTAPKRINRFAEWYGVLFLLLKPAVFILTLMTTPYLLKSNNRLFIFILTMVLFYHVVVTSIFNAPAERYVFTTFPFFLMLLAIGIGAYLKTRNITKYSG